MGEKQPYLSIVSPVFKAESILPELVKRIKNALNKYLGDKKYEIVLVEDGSPDNSWGVIEEICSQDNVVKGIKLSRNFGQHYAITCGLDAAKGDWVVVMDCDLQDQPEAIPELLKEAQKGFDIVFARRVNRQDNFLKKLTSKLFYTGFSYLSGIKQDGSISNFGVFSRKAVEAVNSMREPMRAFSPMMRWVGFSKSYVDVQHGERHSGKSAYNWSTLINLALDISLAYSDKPLKLTIQLGLVISFISAFVAIFLVTGYLLGYFTSITFTGIIVSIWFFSGLIIFTLGIIGLYLGKVFDTVKNRPLYFIDKKLNH